jgi:hypothetical protein
MSARRTVVGGGVALDGELDAGLERDGASAARDAVDRDADKRGVRRAAVPAGRDARLGHNERRRDRLDLAL